MGAGRKQKARAKLELKAASSQETLARLYSCPQWRRRSQKRREHQGAVKPDSSRAVVHGRYTDAARVVLVHGDGDDKTCVPPPCPTAKHTERTVQWTRWCRATTVACTALLSEISVACTAQYARGGDADLGNTTSLQGVVSGLRGAPSSNKMMMSEFYSISKAYNR